MVTEKLSQPEPWSQHLDYLTRRLTEVADILQNCATAPKASPEEIELLEDGMYNLAVDLLSACRSIDRRLANT